MIRKKSLKEGFYFRNPILFEQKNTEDINMPSVSSVPNKENIISLLTTFNNSLNG
jgi:hypothetical protein